MPKSSTSQQSTKWVSLRHDYEIYYDQPSPVHLFTPTVIEVGGQYNLIGWEAGSSGKSEIDRQYQGSDLYGNSIYKVWYEKYYFREMRYISVRGGMYQYRTSIDSDNKNAVPPVTDAKGVPVYTGLPSYTNVEVVTVFAGLAYARVRYSEQIFTSFFLDYLHASSTTFKDPILHGFAIKQDGWRFGVDQTFGYLGARIELGHRPGLDAGYILLSLSLGLFM